MGAKEKKKVLPNKIDPKVFEALKEGAGSQFDADLIDIFFESIDVIKSIQERYPDEE